VATSVHYQDEALAAGRAILRKALIGTAAKGIRAFWKSSSADRSTSLVCSCG
jgi:hypothetical protein